MLRLHAVEVAGPTRWAWRLLDGSGRVLLFHEVSFDPGAWQFAAFTDLYGYLRRNASVDDRVVSEAAIVDQVGRWAGQHVLGEPIGRELASRRPVTVEVVLPAEAELLLTWPLELSYVDGVSLARLGVSLVHVLGATPPAPPAKEPVGADLRILALFSLPSGGSVLSLRRERYELARLVRQVAGRSQRRVELRVLQYGVTRARLSEVVAEHPGWDVVHVAGHGIEGAVLLEHADGSPDQVSTADLVELLRPARQRLKLAVLGVCHSGAAAAAETLRWLRLEEQAEAYEAQAEAEANAEATGLARGLVDRLGLAVLAMRYPVVDTFAVALTRELYSRLLVGRQPVDAAVGQAVPAAAGSVVTASFPALSLGTPALFGPAAGLSVAPPAGSVPMDPSVVRMAGFPVEPERFVGRTQTLIEVNAALAPDSGWSGVLFVGMAGAGKTSCALEVAYQHRQGFEGHLWWQAPTRDDGAAESQALVGVAGAVEQQLGFAMLHAVGSEAALRSFLPRLAVLLRERAVLLVLDNLETLLSSTGRWRDPMFGMFVDAVTGHGGESRVVLTSRVAPAELSGSVLVRATHALGLAESVLLARELPRLGRLLEGEPGAERSATGVVADRELARRVIQVVQGHPKLLELADAAAADPDGLRERVVAAETAARARGASLGVFFSTGGSALDGADFLDVLSAWTTAALAGLPAPARTLVELLACVEDDDRTSFVVEGVWPRVWAARHGDPPPDWGSALAGLQAGALVEVSSGAGQARGFGVHLGVAEAVRAGTDPAWRTVVDEVLADLWAAVYQRAVDQEGRGARDTTQTVVYAGLAAAPYLLRLGRWDAAARLLERAAGRDESPGMTRRVLGHLRQVLDAEPDPGQRLWMECVYAWLLGRVDPAAAQTRLTAVRDSARAHGDHRLASGAAGYLVELLRTHGQLTAALAAADEQVTLTEAAGLGPWAHAANQVQRLRILTEMGQHRQVADLLTHLDTLPPNPGPNETAVPWNVRENLLHTALRAARALGDWAQALDLNQRLTASRQHRGAGPHTIAGTRFNDYYPLLRLGRYDQAEQILLDCQQVFTDTNDIPWLGRVFGARADLQHRRGRPGEAITLDHTALRYTYQQPRPDDLAASHHNLASHLTAAGHHPDTILAHRLAAALLHHATGRTTDLATTLHQLAADLQTHPHTTPPDLATLTTTVEQVPGVGFHAVLTALVPEPETQAAMLAEIIEAARATDPTEQWAPLIDAVVAATGGDGNTAAELAPLLDELGATADWGALVGVLRRVIDGERGDGLLDGLDGIDTLVVREVLDRLSG